MAFLLRARIMRDARLCCGLIVVAAYNALHSPSAIAQEANAESSLNTIVVTGSEVTDSYTAPNATTATKTDTPLMETPVSVQVIPHQLLIDQQALGLDQALSNAGGIVTYGEEPGQEAMVIRGFFTTAILWNGFRIDEYSTTGGGTVGAVLMDNVDRVEVMKGPAGILYGRVEPGGMVSVITKQPEDRFSGTVSAMVGSWRHDWLGVDLTGPINDSQTLFYRLNASQEYSDSWQWGASFRSLALAPVFEWRIDPDTRLSLEGEFRHATLSSPVSAVPVDPANGQLYPVPMQYSPLPGASTFDLSRFYVHLSHRFDGSWSASVKLFHTLTVEPVYTDQYLNQAYFPPVSANNLTVDRAVFEGATRNRTDATMIDVVGHVNTFGLRHTVLVGGDYYYTPIEQPLLGYTCCFTTNFFNPTPVPQGAATNPPPGGFSFSGENNQASRDFGIYLQDQIAFPGRVHLLAGVRYQHYIETSDSSSAIGQPVMSMMALADHIFTPRFGLLWRARDWLSTYYSYTENFGSNSGFAFPNVPLPPQNARQHEVGVKTEFYGGRLTSSLAWYQLTKFNIAAADPSHMSFNVDIGEVRSRGYEFDLQGGIARNWDVITNFSFVLPYVVVGGNGYPAGDRLQGVPEYTFNLWTTYKLSQESLRGWKVGGGVNWRASSAYPGTALETDAYWDTSLLAAYEHQFDGYKATLQLNISNLLDKTAIVKIYPVTSNNYADLNYATRREFRLSARVDF